MTMYMSVSKYAGTSMLAKHWYYRQREVSSLAPDLSMSQAPPANMWWSFKSLQAFHTHTHTPCPMNTRARCAWKQWKNMRDTRRKESSPKPTKAGLRGKGPTKGWGRNSCTAATSQADTTPRTHTQTKAKQPKPKQKQQPNSGQTGSTS